MGGDAHPDDDTVQRVVAAVEEIIAEHDDLTLADVRDTLAADAGLEQDKGVLGKVRGSSISRRTFLKTLGIGAGSAALARPGASWSILQPLSFGVSDVDADTLDGAEASKLGRDVARDRNGSVRFTGAGTADVTTPNTGNRISTATSTTGLVVVEQLTGKLINGGGPVTLKRNDGATTIASGANTVTATVLTHTMSPKWTLSATPTTSSPIITTYSTALQATANDVSTTYTLSRKTTLTGTGRTISASLYAKSAFFDTYTVYIRRDGNTFAQTTNYNVTNGNTTTTGTFTNPVVTFAVHGDGTTNDTGDLTLSTRSATLKTSAVMARLTASKNQFTKVYA